MGGAGGTLKSLLTGLCLDAAVSSGYDSMFKPCDGKATQDAALNKTSGHFTVEKQHCLDIYKHMGPYVSVNGCKQPGEHDENQRFTLLAGSGHGGTMVQSAIAPQNGKSMCLTVAEPSAKNNALLFTTDPATGKQWCLGVSGPQAPFAAIECDPSRASAVEVGPDYRLFFAPNAAPGGGPGGGPGQTTANRTGHILSPKMNYNGGYIGLGYSLAFGSSGPVPHSRWTFNGGNSFWFDVDAAGGSTVQAVDTKNIIDDDNVGHVTKGGAFCLELSAAGSLEVWASVLSEAYLTCLCWTPT